MKQVRLWRETVEKRDYKCFRCGHKLAEERNGKVVDVDTEITLPGPNADASVTAIILCPKCHDIAAFDIEE